MYWLGQPGTHNGGQSFDSGFGAEEVRLQDILGERVVIAEQRHYPYDQLRMGARNIELDVYHFERFDHASQLCRNIFVEQSPSFVLVVCTYTCCSVHIQKATRT